MTIDIHKESHQKSDSKEPSAQKKKTIKPAPVSRRRKPMKPAAIIALGFLGLILIGAFFLTLPISNRDGNWFPFVDALFTATSASCVTGLIVADTLTQFTTFGQIVIIVLIQAGGLGVMTFTTLLFFLIGKRITLKDRLVMQSALNEDTNSGLLRLVRNMVIVTAVIETIGACLLMIAFIPAYGVSGVGKAFFTAISAFCNAGFDVFGMVDGVSVSMTLYASNVLVMLSAAFLIILGGMGFAVIMEALKKRRFRKFSFHTKTVLVTTAALLLVGTIGFLITESKNARIDGIGFGQHLLNSFFAATTARTAGFAAVDYAKMSAAGKSLTMMLMFVGASPASTGGGIKTTTLALLLLMLLSGMRGRTRVVVANRQLTAKLLLRAVSLTVLMAIYIAIVTLIILQVESFNPNFSPEMLTSENVLFEVISAATTTGLSLGITPMLSSFSKVLLSLTMFIGRIGPVTIGLLFISRPTVTETIEYPDANIMIG